MGMDGPSQKMGTYCHKTARDKTSQGRIIPGTDHPRDASSHFFQGRIVQGRNVRAPCYTQTVFPHGSQILNGGRGLELKGQCHEIFDPPFFSSIDYPWAPD
jgi:hypothetical protein